MSHTALAVNFHRTNFLLFSLVETDKLQHPILKQANGRVRETAIVQGQSFAEVITHSEASEDRRR
jgi:hypothetical protein